MIEANKIVEAVKKAGFDLRPLVPLDVFLDQLNIAQLGPKPDFEVCVCVSLPEHVNSPALRPCYLSTVCPIMQSTKSEGTRFFEIVLDEMEPSHMTDVGL